MHASSRFTFGLMLASVLALALTGCSADSKKSHLLEQANRYYADGKYDEAEIDYKNVLQIDGMNGDAIGQLGLIYFNQGRLSRSYVYILKARELRPDNYNLRLKLGQIYFTFGQVAEARDEALFVLERQPENAEAALLLADSARNPKDIADARKRLDSLSTSMQGQASVVLARGILDFRLGHPKEAEAAIQRALSLEPKLPEAHTAMAGIYQSRQDTAHADQEYATAAQLSPARSQRRLQYAQFKIQEKDYAAARKLLEEMSTKTPDYLPGLIALAQLSGLEKKYDEANALLTKVLAKDDGQPEALLLKSRLDLAMGNPTKAVEDAQRMLRFYPKSAQAYQQLALCHIANNDPDKAIESLNQALTLSPDYLDAALMFGSLNNRKRNYSATIIAMKRVLEKHADVAQAWLLLAEAYRQQGDPAGALSVYGEMEKRFPKVAETSYLSGMAYLQQNRRDDARAAFEQALTLSPHYGQAQAQLIALDAGEDKFPDAIKRANAMIAENPKLAGPYLLLSRVYFAQKDMPKVESTLRKAIEVEPDSPDAYYLLTSVYVSTQRLGQAQRDLEKLIAKNPRDAKALALAAVIYEKTKNYPAARDTYEKLLAINPKFLLALNNLAYLYAEQFHDLDKALDTAQKAHDIQPQEPHTSDTLGWILYRKHQYVRAATLLDDSAGKVPDSPEILYHDGMAHYMLGEEDTARTLLRRALQPNTPFPGDAEARQSLALLDLVPAAANRASLEKTVAASPDDPVALARLASVYEREGASDKAIATNESALEKSPFNVKVMLNLIRLYNAKKDTTKAFDLAKSARKVAPLNPDVAYALGQLAFQNGDTTWAAGLLQDAARKLPDNADVQFEYGVAAYSVGRVGEATTALQAALAANATFSHAAQARQMLELIALAANPTPAGAAKIEPVLRADETNVPALMARAALAGQKGDAAAAKADYEKALARYPNFVPAMRGLAIYYANNPGEDQKAYDLAAKAREALPGDPDVAKALGIIIYRRGEFPRAAGLLSESASRKPDDAETMFYLGMAQSRLKNTASTKSLQRALNLGLNGDMAAEAKKTLEAGKK